MDTFSNYQEANRIFWRNSVVPLVTRALANLSDWLHSLRARLRRDTFPGGPVTLVPDVKFREDPRFGRADPIAI